jgi:hypothetical protein
VGSRQITNLRGRLPASDFAAASSPALLKQDEHWANDLIVLMSTLEQDRVGLAALRHGTNPGEVLALVVKMVDAVSKLAGGCSVSESSSDELQSVLAEAQELCSSLAELQAEFDESIVRAVVQIFRRSALSGKERRAQFRLLVGRLPEVLKRFFALFGTHFKAPPAAREWQQTYPLFLADLERVLSNLRCP